MLCVPLLFSPRESAHHAGMGGRSRPRAFVTEIDVVEMPFHVREWLVDKRIAGEMLACARNAYVAQAAYAEAVKHCGDRAIILCQGGRVMKKHPADIVI